ncbi:MULTISPECIES: HAD family hydrolase [Pyrococcus]|uniref:HAD family hydrolase n=1 Tax=Pyrococcus TaxID=2260 RepID=UPI00258D8D25|nr:HAD family hydrolase [Pyrococcus sp.]MDK2869316.1 putative hydrolase of the superfamily [Pyrococcus sp.]
MLIILDLDDTLCNTWEAIRIAAIRLIPTLLRLRKFRMFAYILTKRYRELEEIRELHILGFEEILDRIINKIYKNLENEEVQEIANLFDRTFFANLRLYPDVIPFLEKVREMGAKIVLVTDSSSSWQRRKLEVLGIKDYFDAIIVSGDTGHSKFEPYNFHLARKKFPREKKVYVIGDRDDTDMKGGKAIHATTILVKRGYFKGRRAKYADYVVNNLYEALEVIERDIKN